LKRDIKAQYMIIFMNNKIKNKKNKINNGLSNKWNNKNKCKDQYLTKVKKFIMIYNKKNYKNYFKC
jgi:hypothetical protein